MVDRRPNYEHCRIGFARFDDFITHMARHHPGSVHPEVLEATKRVLRLIAETPPPLYELLRNLSTDMHVASNRPCKTCRQFTEKLGWPFGCYERQAKTKRVLARRDTLPADWHRELRDLP